MDFQSARLLAMDVRQDFKNSVDASLHDELDYIISTPIAPEMVSQFFEFGYANRTSLPANVLNAVAAVGLFASEHGFYGLGENSRGFNMLTVLTGGQVDNPPEPKEQYIFTAPVAEVEPVNEA